MVTAGRPIIQNLSTSDVARTDMPVDVSYTYHGGVEGETVLKWYSVDADGQNVKEIGAARGKCSYTPTAFEVGSMLFVEVIPVRKDGLQGDPVISDPFGPVEKGEGVQRVTMAVSVSSIGQAMTATYKSSLPIKLTTHNVRCLMPVGVELSGHPNLEAEPPRYQWQIRANDDRKWIDKGTESTFVPCIDYCNLKVRVQVIAQADGVEGQRYVSTPQLITLDKKKTADALLNKTKKQYVKQQCTVSSNSKECHVILTHQGVRLGGPAFQEKLEFGWASFLNVQRSGDLHNLDTGIDFNIDTLNKETFKLRLAKELDREMFLGLFRLFHGLSLSKICVPVLGQDIFTRWESGSCPPGETPIEKSAEPIDASAIGFRQAKDILIALKPLFVELSSR